MNFEKKTEIIIGDRTLTIYGDPESANRFIQPVDEHDEELMISEAEKVMDLCGHTDWCIAALRIKSWNTELTPWSAPPVFGKEGFGDGAEHTLKLIIEKIIPLLDQKYPNVGRKYYLCGYSLAGLFSLWSAYQTDVFAGIAAVSPSVWYQDWQSYMHEHEIRTKNVYLSLGRKEEKARNKVMASVGDAIRSQYALLQNSVNCTLEWNEGNHFVDSDGRTAKAIAWLLNQ